MNESQKISGMVSKSTDADNLLKPELAVQLWGPKYSDVDIPEEFDQSRNFAESRYSTYQHTDNSDCPAFADISKKIYTQPFIKNERWYYPCNIGGCAKSL